ncbi:RHS repeat domain-containing protein [Polluticaenibacter yanchengensis]|uniref:RHS repeat protein n=1 Tax=Polluticaenibacter yanchengensis TaxID=3014562 RepID=A0ABT4UNW5_9BACT|nr:RHS repeat protein [Chitinophagaceae bacterium LY-5]
MNFVNKLLLLFSLVIMYVLCFPIVSNAQTKDLILPSPEVEMFRKYGEFNHDLSRGVIDISIPLYKIKSGEIEMDIVLRYNGTSGIKPYENDNNKIGLGWILDVGGVVSRTVKGKPDDLYARPAVFKNPDDIQESNESDFNYLVNVLDANGTVDVQRDHFSFSFQGETTNFILNEENNIFKSYITPFKPYNIKVNSTNAPVINGSTYHKRIDNFEIINDKGFKYLFGGNGNIETYLIESQFGTSAWFLNEVIDNNNFSKIKLEYIDVNNLQRPKGDYWTQSVYQEMGLAPNLYIFGSGAYVVPCRDAGVPDYLLEVNAIPQQLQYNTKNIKYINFDNGKVIFNYTNDNKYLNEIVIEDSDGNIIKRILFNKSQFYGGELKLNSLDFKDYGNSTQEKYEFSYDERNINEYNTTVDFWGYCNGVNPDPTIINKTTLRNDVSYYPSQASPHSGAVYYTNIGNTSHEPNELFVEYNILKSIKYPYSGYSKFYYEPNIYLENDPTGTIPKNGGGVRIKRIENYSDDNKKVYEKKYEYDPGFTNFSVYDITKFTSTTFYVDNVLDCNPPFYSSGMGDDPFLFRNRLFYNNWSPYLGDNSVRYNEASEIFSSDDDNNGKITYNYQYTNKNQFGILKNSYGATHFYIRQYREWGNGLIKSKQYFKFNNQSYIKTKMEEFNYQFEDLYTFNDMLVARNLTGLGTAPTNSYYWLKYVANDNCALSLPNMFGANLHQNVIGKVSLIDVSTSFYEDNILLSEKTLEYEPVYNLVRSEEIKNSKGTINKTSYTYPFDYPTVPVYQQMVTRNIIAPVIEQTNFVNNIQTQRVTTNYYNPFSNIYVPQSVTNQKGSFAQETVATFNLYDNTGNLLEQQKADNIKEAYLWGYNGHYPVAKIIGSNYATVSTIPSLNLSLLNTGTEAQKAEQLNLVRNYFAGNKNVHVSTYSYRPLVGMLSETDPNGKTSSYEYDSFNRLKLIKDDQGNILKKFEYKYQQPQ